ncbi:MAG: MBL fold metallo-hydrolase [Pseudomonadota bacterium]
MTLKISRILHAGYVFECEGTQIAFDPIFENPFSRNCHAFPQVRFDHAKIRELKLDAVFISHFHDDHCSMESLDLLDRATPIYAYCLFDELFAMIGELGFTHVHRLRVDGAVPIGAITVTPRAALDADVDSMFQIQAAGLNVLNVVDSQMAPDTLDQLARFAPWDMVLWPFQTMREIAVLAPSRAEPAPLALPADWIDELRVLDPRYIVPSSCQFVQEPWSWYNHAMFPVTYRQFAREIGAALPAARVVRFNPSVSFELDAVSLSSAAPLDWVLPIGEQDVDYDYRPGAVPPPTADIARHFAALTPEQNAVVLAYCHTGLLEKYEDMEQPEFFETLRYWRLAVYDHAGECATYYYRLHGESITLLDNEPAPLAWTTEIPIAKFYAALALGESLTSMYMRINDAVFEAAIEADIAEADVVDDPLIRCLFNADFGAYQAAQLKRLKGA